MRQLLDTHTFIWFVTENTAIGVDIQHQIENNDNLISIASIWETAIKSSIGKLSLGLSIEQLVNEQIIANGIEILDITTKQLEIVESLPLHHRDPFDRLIISQAIIEKIPIIGIDETFDRYEVPIAIA